MTPSDSEPDPATPSEKDPEGDRTSEDFSDFDKEDAEDILTRDEVMRMSLIVEGGMGAAALAIGFYFGVPFAKSIHLNPFYFPEIGIGVACAIVGAMVALLAQRLPMGFARRLKVDSQKIVTRLLWQCTIPDLIGISLLAGVGEELFFRGLLQQGLIMVIPDPWVVTGIVAVLFGLLHSMSIPYIFAAAIASVGLSTLMLFTDDLVTCMVCHAVYDLILLLVLVRQAPAPATD